MQRLTNQAGWSGAIARVQPAAPLAHAAHWPATPAVCGQARRIVVAPAWPTHELAVTAQAGVIFLAKHDTYPRGLAPGVPKGGRP